MITPMMDIWGKVNNNTFDGEEERGHDIGGGGG